MRFTRIAVAAIVSAVGLAACETGPEKPTGRNPGVPGYKPTGRLDRDHNFAEEKHLENLHAGLPSWWSDEARVDGSGASVCAVGAAGRLSVAYDLALRNARTSGQVAMKAAPTKVDVERAGVSRTPGGDYVVRMLARCEGPQEVKLAVAPSVAEPTPVAAPVAPVVAVQPAPGDLTDGTPAWYGSGTTIVDGRWTAAVRRDARTLVEARRLVVEAGRDELNRACGGEARDVRTLQTAAQRLSDGTWRAYASMSAAPAELSKK